VVSHATILSGAYPQSTEMSEIGGTLPASLPYLPDLLKARGYRTAAFVGSIALDPRNGLAQGFDRGFQTYDAGFRPPIAGDARPPLTTRSASQVVANALAWMRRNPQGPSFVWIHLNDPRASGAGYNAAITAANAAVGKLVASLKQQKAYANTAILVVADHGESLGAHGEDGHGFFLYDGRAACRETRRRQSATGGRGADPARSRGDPRTVTDAGAVTPENRQSQRRRRPAGLFPQRPFAAGIRLEPAGIVARRKVPLHSRA
jgi:arylsulfatase A-like enzyme